MRKSEYGLIGLLLRDSESLYKLKELFSLAKSTSKSVGMNLSSSRKLTILPVRLDLVSTVITVSGSVGIALISAILDMALAGWISTWKKWWYRHVWHIACARAMSRLVAVILWLTRVHLLQG